MFTLINFINYSSGRPFNHIILCILTILIYFYLFRYHGDTLLNNNIYLTILLFLMIIDISSIIIVFTMFDNISDDNKVSIYKKSKSKKSSSKKSKSKKSKKTKDIIENDDKPLSVTSVKTYSLNNINKNTINIKKEENIKEIISLYDVNKDLSLKTY